MIQEEIDLIMPLEMAMQFERFVNLNLSYLNASPPDSNGDCEVHLRFRENQEKQWVNKGIEVGFKEGFQHGRSEVFDRLRHYNS